MVRSSPAIQISFGLALLTMSVLLTADVIGLVPDRDEAVLDARKKTREALAVQFSLAVQRNDVAVVEETMHLVVRRNPDILSAALRSADGKLLASAGDHEKHWQGPEDGKSNRNCAEVPVFRDGRRWGAVEVRFSAIGPGGILGFLTGPLFRLVAFATLAGFVVYMLFMKRALRRLDPSAVVPARVRSAMDALAEGVVLLDKRERIVLANASFVQHQGDPAPSLLGREVSELGWSAPGSSGELPVRPWTEAIATGKARTGVPVTLATPSRGKRTFTVNAAPILDGNGKTRGALVTFDDVTELEQRNTQLRGTLKMLEKSRDEVSRKNQELEILAARDPLTECLNRRSFFEGLDAEFSAARRYDQVISCIMIDIDRFKSVNDRHGHAAGDLVLRQVAGELRSMLRTSDSICRYGGEEFCILLRHSGLEAAAEATERFRLAVEAKDCSGLRVTASFGVSSSELDVSRPQELLDRADKALYTAKNAGGNRVVCWDESYAQAAAVASTDAAKRPARERKAEASIPLHVVNSLAFALARRDIGTAEHCRQVADLCAAVARDFLPPSQCFVLEVAAQLHDIGKLTVPDEILLKPGPLSDEERKIMYDHIGRGVQIIAATIPVPSLIEIVSNRHVWYKRRPSDPDAPEGDEIPLGARILAIADAFSAMVSHRPYRKPRSSKEAVAELRRCAGTQFDPQLVERFAETVQSRDDSRKKDESTVSSAVKLEIGQEVERLAAALKAVDISMLSVTARRLAATARKQGLHTLADLAAEVERSAAQGEDLLKIAQLITRLTALCTSGQEADLAGGDAERPAEEILSTTGPDRTGSPARR